MNSRQAARAAAKKIEELESYNRRAAADIKGYNRCILDLIEGGSPCNWCEEQKECQLKAKEEGKGCSEWWLTFDLPASITNPEEDPPSDGADDMVQAISHDGKVITGGDADA